VNSLTADGKSVIELEGAAITEEDKTTQNIENIREFSQKLFSHRMGWDGISPSHAKPWNIP
jgi:hypothetical protein